MNSHTNNGQPAKRHWKRNAIIASLAGAMGLAAVAAVSAPLLADDNRPMFGRSEGRQEMRGDYRNGPQGKMRGEHRGDQRGMMPGLQALTLTDEQRSQLDEVMDGIKAQRDAHRTAMRANHDAMRATMTADEVDLAKVQGLANAQGALVSQSIVQRAETHAKVLAILTPEQQEQLQQAQASFRGGPQGFDGAHGRRGHGDDHGRRGHGRW